MRQHPNCGTCAYRDLNSGLDDNSSQVFCRQDLCWVDKDEQHPCHSHALPRPDALNPAPEWEAEFLCFDDRGDEVRRQNVLIAAAACLGVVLGVNIYLYIRANIGAPL